jgi:hypothetical protein
MGRTRGGDATTGVQAAEIAREYGPFSDASHVHGVTFDATPSGSPQATRSARSIRRPAGPCAPSKRAPPAVCQRYLESVPHRRRHELTQRATSDHLRSNGEIGHQLSLTRAAWPTALYVHIRSAR